MTDILSSRFYNVCGDLIENIIYQKLLDIKSAKTYNIKILIIQTLIFFWYYLSLSKCFTLIIYLSWYLSIYLTFCYKYEHDIIVQISHPATYFSKYKNICSISFDLPVYFNLKYIFIIICNINPLIFRSRISKNIQNSSHIWT